MSFTTVKNVTTSSLIASYTMIQTVRWTTGSRLPSSSRDRNVLWTTVVRVLSTLTFVCLKLESSYVTSWCGTHAGKPSFHTLIVLGTLCISPPNNTICLPFDSTYTYSWCCVSFGFSCFTRSPKTSDFSSVSFRHFSIDLEKLLVKVSFRGNPRKEQNIAWVVAAFKEYWGLSEW